jgi:hypothetical protein
MVMATSAVGETGYCGGNGVMSSGGWRWPMAAERARKSMIWEAHRNRNLIAKFERALKTRA